MADKITQKASQSTPISFSHHIKAKIALVWTQRVAPLYAQVSLNVLREVCELITFRPLLLTVSTTKLVLLDPFEGDQWTLELREIGVSVLYSSPGTCVRIGDNQFFLCGGKTNRWKDYVRQAFVIDNEQAVQLPDTHDGHYGHGVHFHEASQRVFVFGSYSPQECYDFKSATWTLLENPALLMTFISTCAYQEKVFLCGRGADFIAVFRVATLDFAYILAAGESFSYVAVWRKQLVVIGSQQVRKYCSKSYELIKKQEFSGEYIRQVQVINDSMFILKSKWAFYEVETMTEERTLVIET